MANKEPTKTIIDKLAEQLKDSGEYRLLVFQCFEDMYFKTRSDIGGKSIFSLINYDMVDAMVVVPGSMHDDTVIEGIAENCGKFGVPLISVDVPVNGASCVMFDYGDAFGGIVEHILEYHNCKRIKLIAGIKDNSFSETRVERCRGIMAKHGLTLGENDVFYCDFWEGPTYEAMERFFASGEPLPDVFICCNDTMAMAVCLKLSEHGYHVPDDVLVTGFDGIETEKYHQPRLTTSSCSNQALAEAILDMAERLISDKAAKPYQTVLKNKPVFSESCGCALPDNGDHNHKLSELVKSYSYLLNYEEHVNGMENSIATDPSLENVCKMLKKYCFGNTLICLTDEFYRYFSGEDSGKQLEQFRGFGDMHEFVCTMSDGRTIDRNATFPAKKLIPMLENSFSEYNTLFVVPVHFQDMVQGYLVSHYVPDEHHNERLYSYCTSLNRCLETMRTHEHLAALNQRLEFMFNHDQLTRIFNRYGFYNGFRSSFISLEGEKRDVFIVSIDLNDMKYINDTFGHSAGDEALCITANALSAAAENCGGDVICSRFGGDEFVAAKICAGDAVKQSEIYRESFVRALEKINAESGKPFEVVVSMGVYAASLEGVDSIDGLIELADRLMYSDKARHKRHPRSNA